MGIVQVPLQDWDLLTPYSQVLPIQDLTNGSLLGLCHVRMETHFQCQQSITPPSAAAGPSASAILQAGAPGFLPSADFPMLTNMPFHDMPGDQDAAPAPAPWQLRPLCQPSSPACDAQDRRAFNGHGRVSLDERGPDGMPTSEPLDVPRSSAQEGQEGQLPGEIVKDLPSANGSATLGDQDGGHTTNCGLFSFLAANIERYAAHCWPPAGCFDMQNRDSDKYILQHKLDVPKLKSAY